MIHLSTSVCPFLNMGKHTLHSHPHPWPDPYCMVRAESFICYLAQGCRSHPQAVPSAGFARLVIPLLILGPPSGCPYTFLHANLLTKKMAPDYLPRVVSSLPAPVTRLTVSHAVSWLMSASYVIAHRPQHSLQSFVEFPQCSSLSSLSAA